MSQGRQRPAPAQVAVEIESRLLERQGERKGEEINALCPFHSEEKPSFGYNVVKQVYCCQACGASGGWRKLAERLNVDVPANRAERRRHTKAERRIVATYDYHDEGGTLLFQTVRLDPKDFRQRRPDEADGWVWNLDGVRRVLYRTPDLVDPTVSNEVVYLAEGEKDVDRLRGEGLVTTCNPMGAGKWRPEYTEQLRGRHVVVIPDNDDPGRQHAAAVASSLFGVAASVAVLELPNLAEKGDVSDWLANGGTVDQLVELANAAEPLRAVPLAELVEVFRRWLHLPDPFALYIVLATVIANRMRGDAVWLMVIAAPGHGKTEAVGALVRVPHIFAVATLTESALLSGTAQKDRSKDATGGLLRQIGDFGIIVCKDFTSILSMHRDARAGVLAALREVYDGAWSRRLGTDGGRELAWSGKVGLIAACTPAIDSYYSVVASMGDRFVSYRLPDTDEDAQALAALNSIGSEDIMRGELSAATKAFLDGIVVPEVMPTLTDTERRRLSALAGLTVRCRSAVERDPQRREIVQVPQPEAPARVVRVLAKLLIGLRLIGVEAGQEWAIIEKCALDCMPQVRRSVFDVLRTATAAMETADIALQIGYPTETARRALQDLAAHGVLTRESQGKGNADLWMLSQWTLGRLAIGTVSEKSGNGSDGSSASVSEKSDGGHTHSQSEPTSSLFNLPIRAEDDLTETPPPFFGDTPGGGRMKPPAHPSADRGSTVRDRPPEPFSDRHGGQRPC